MSAPISTSPRHIASGLTTGRHGDLVAALDIGCAKIGCLIARIDPNCATGYRLIGGGEQSSYGFETGSITDMDALERAVRLAVEEAEQAAGETVSDVIVGMSAPQLGARLVRAEIDIGGREVTPRDVRKVLATAMQRFGTASEAEGAREVLAATPIAFAIAGAEGVRDPVGMYTNRLGVLVNVVHAALPAVLNLKQCLSRAHLETAAILPSATASALGTLNADEKENGAICLDLGAGVTAISVFLNGVPAWFTRLAVGGSHVTRDIAQGYGTTFAAAERVKTIHGQAGVIGASGADLIDCPRIGDDGRLQAASLSRDDLSAIISPRIEETFEMVAKRLDGSPLRSILPRRLVLTGGASQLAGLRGIAEAVLRRPVRLARPADAEHLGETYALPGFSTAAGLLTFAMTGLPDAGRGGAAWGQDGAVKGGKLVSKAVGWLRENF